MSLMGLQEERKRLDEQLDAALAQFALYEEELNRRWHGASPEQVQMLMAERAQMEETLGIADLVIRIDDIRQQIDQIRHQAA